MGDGAIRDEDQEVIESIRRLVTDRSAALRSRSRPSPVSPVDVPDKLVLTPALRVEPGPAADATPTEADAADLPSVENTDERSEESVVAWSLEDRIAELEAALGGATGDWEPDGSEDADQETPRQFVFAHRPLSLAGREAEPDTRAARAAEAAEARVAAVGSEPPAAPEAGSPDASEAPVRVAEPADMRALITEIVREELRGALGRKATQNIRKLVRREIRRALDAQDLGD